MTPSERNQISLLVTLMVMEVLILTAIIINLS